MSFLNSIRGISRSNSSSYRVLSNISRSGLLRSTSLIASRSAILRSATTIAPRFFSVSSVVKDADSAKRVLQKTLQREYEEETVESDGIDTPPVEVTKFLESSGFEVNKKPGQSQVELVKKSGDEIIHVFFDVSQVLENQEISDLAEDDAEINLNEEPHENDEIPDDLNDEFVQISITIEKPAINRAISLSASLGADKSIFFLDSIVPYDDIKLALQETPEAVYKRATLYKGPTYSNLDPQLQESFEDYLSARDIDGRLGEFVFEYSFYAENKEYISWLDNMNKFFKN